MTFSYYTTDDCGYDDIVILLVASTDHSCYYALHAGRRLDDDVHGPTAMSQRHSAGTCMQSVPAGENRTECTIVS